MNDRDINQSAQAVSPALDSSGEINYSGEHLTIDALPEGMTMLAPGSAMHTFYSKITPDARPGDNTLIITGLPSITRVISVWVTEWTADNNSHAGGAWISTSSVQLFDGGTKCRVRFNLEWNSNLPTACMVIYGPA
jgi:hypothetical protein